MALSRRQLFATGASAIAVAALPMPTEPVSLTPMYEGQAAFGDQLLATATGEMLDAWAAMQNLTRFGAEPDVELRARLTDKIINGEPRWS
jgi:hypothetical protein